jgi:hypothetical protein
MMLPTKLSVLSSSSAAQCGISLQEKKTIGGLESQ